MQAILPAPHTPTLRLISAFISSLSPSEAYQENRVGGVQG